MKEVYVVCKNFNTPEVLFYDTTIGFNREKVKMFTSKTEAFMFCASELTLSDVSLEKFVTNQQATVH